MGTHKSVPWKGRSGNLRGTKTIVTSKFKACNKKMKISGFSELIKY